jgi:hypothetical protein
MAASSYWPPRSPKQIQRPRRLGLVDGHVLLRRSATSMAFAAAPASPAQPQVRRAFLRVHGKSRPPAGWPGQGHHREEHDEHGDGTSLGASPGPARGSTSRTAMPGTATPGATPGTATPPAAGDPCHARHGALLSVCPADVLVQRRDRVPGDMHGAEADEAQV